MLTGCYGTLGEISWKFHYEKACVRFNLKIRRNIQDCCYFSNRINFRFFFLEGHSNKLCKSRNLYTVPPVPEGDTVFFCLGGLGLLKMTRSSANAKVEKQFKKIKSNLQNSLPSQDANLENPASNFGNLAS